MVVTPPAAAARLAVARVSRCSWPGLAGKDHHVDQAGRKHVAVAIDDLRIADGVGRDLRAEIGDEVASDQHAAALIEARGRIDQPGIDEGDGG